MNHPVATALSLLSIIIMMIMAGTAPVEAQAMPCGPVATVWALLAERYGEQPLAGGLNGDG